MSVRALSAARWLSLFLAIAWSGLVLAGEPRPPNVVLFMTDDMGAECVGCYQAEAPYATPNLDRLAAGGMRFEFCFSQPLCTPSRVKLMTGRSNARNYVRFGWLDPGEVTFGNLLRDAGYATAVVGKWQLGGEASEVAARGFDRHCLWQIGGRPSRYWEPGIVEDGVLRDEGIRERFGPDVVNEYALAFIDGHRDRPFFLYYPMILPHWPFVPTPDSPAGGSRERIGRYDGQAGGEEYFPDMVAYADKLVGRVVDRIDALGLAESTLILFTSDNGTATNIRSRWRGRAWPGGKGFLTDHGTRIPGIARWKGIIEPGVVSRALVDLSDFLPTVVEAAGGTPPAGLDGISFLPVLRGADRDGRREWVAIHYNPRPEQVTAGKEARLTASKQLGRFVRDRRFKLYGDGRFYDVETDVEETMPIEGPAHEGVRRRFREVLERLPAWDTGEAARRARSAPRS